MAAAEHAVVHHEAQEHAHPSARLYVGIGAILAVITVVEIWISYAGFQRLVFVLSLALLSAAKFILVVGFYMHLKFDHPYFRYIFAFGLFVALAVFTAVTFLFMIHPTPPPPAPTLPAH
jgi:cytochrome c oxidase subunit 4